jgi:hypothetical protein
MSPTKVLLALTKDQQLHVRNLQVFSQAAQLKVHQYKQQADAELNRLQTDANTKSQIVINFLNQVGTASKIDVTKSLFDFESLAFIEVPDQVPANPTPAPALTPLAAAQQVLPPVPAPTPVRRRPRSVAPDDVAIPPAAAPPETAS